MGNYILNKFSISFFELVNECFKVILDLVLEVFEVIERMINVKSSGFIFVRKGFFLFFINWVMLCFLGELYVLIGKEERKKLLILGIDVFELMLRVWERIISFVESDLFVRGCFLIKRYY